MRIGYGCDSHRLEEGRRLVIGGVEIPFEKGLLGHSDADVLVHAVIDALFGAAALGDIGSHFPDTDPAYKNADSMQLLRAAVEAVEAQRLRLGNLDCVILAERPKMAPYIDRMRENIAEACHTSVKNISIKAKTNEKMGFIGKQEGMEARCVALLTEIHI